MSKELKNTFLKDKENKMANSQLNPDWMKDLISEQTQALRSKIVRLVRKHCLETGDTYPEAWNTVYERFTKATGLSFRECQGKKLDFVEQHDHLGSLLTIVQTL
jgi:hypothetical protein